MLDQRLHLVLPMVTFVPEGMGGSEIYARELTAALTRRNDLEVKVLVSRGAAGSFPSSVEHVMHGVRGGRTISERLMSLARGFCASSAVRQLVNTADVVHYPFTVPVPRARAPWIQTVHDVQHLDLPELFSAAERGYRAIAYDRPARRARRIVTLSQFSKDRIVEHFRIDPRRVAVAHSGVNTEAFKVHAGPREPFVLYPAAAWPHKNHRTLIEAMRRVREERPGFRLVLTGGNQSALGPLPAWVEHRGFVDRAELAALYGAASCLAFPSRYEGFGLPVLEAMASGCPVAAAHAGSLPEICGNAAILFDPASIDATARAVIQAMESRERLTSLGLERIKNFTWTGCAEAHNRVYREVAGQSIDD